MVGVFVIAYCSSCHVWIHNCICLNLKIFKICNLINFYFSFSFFRYSPDGKGFPPRWSCFLCALGLFIYQSLDAIDGKQARRTNTSTPLGELFDHGCDSISTIFVALSACISCQLGHYPNWLFFQVIFLFWIQLIINYP